MVKKSAKVGTKKVESFTDKERFEKVADKIYKKNENVFKKLSKL